MLRTDQRLIVVFLLCLLESGQDLCAFVKVKSLCEKISDLVMELSSTTPIDGSATGLQEESVQSRDASFPFLKLPPELCLRILKHFNPKRSCYGDLRLLCKAVNDLIKKNRSTLGGLRAKRLIIGQHSSFNRCPRRFVVSESGKLPDCLDSCALGYVEQVFFYMVKIETIALGHIVSNLRKNRINVTAMIFYGVEFVCEASSLVDLFDVSVTKCVVMIECELSIELKTFLEDSLVQQIRMKTFFIGSSPSFEMYMKSIMPSEDWIKRLLQWTLSLVSDTLGRTQVICFHHYRHEINNASGSFYMVQTNPVQSCIWGRLILYYPVMLTRHESKGCVPKWMFLLIPTTDGSQIEFAAMSSRTPPVKDPFPHFY